MIQVRVALLSDDRDGKDAGPSPGETRVHLRDVTLRLPDLWDPAGTTAAAGGIDAAQSSEHFWPVIGHRVTVTAERTVATATAARRFWRRESSAHPACLLQLGPQAVLIVESLTVKYFTASDEASLATGGIGCTRVRFVGASLQLSPSALPLDLPLLAAVEAHACGICSEVTVV
ncbi:hypothetical protein FNF28_02904 [Cafeteria roenbergensis]|uniref:Uncharacterized protein n=1 Tax=Cafeteria roenbergensis TaxID=33653 RepID=A0A5A8DRC3_CAFRO|nr:hypothetical protein FNF28_02904 [Cafeteria roenbergensis]